jgi:hypothetical protein
MSTVAPDVANTRGEKVAQIKETNTCDDEYKKFNRNTIQLTCAIKGEKQGSNFIQNNDEGLSTGCGRNWPSARAPFSSMQTMEDILAQGTYLLDCLASTFTWISGLNQRGS